MNKELTISMNGTLFPVSVEKVDRAELYGPTTSQTVEDGEPCTRVQVLMDGIVLGSKSTAKTLTINGRWIEEEETRRYAPDGTELVKQESSFKAPPMLTGTPIDHLLAYCVKAVYALNRPVGGAGQGLQVWQADFIYTAGYPKPAFFLQGADGQGYMLVSEPARCDWVGHQDCLTGETEEWSEDDMEELFG